MLVAGGATSVTTYFALRLVADGTAATGLTITDFDLQYVRSGVAPVAKVDATALVATDSSWDDNKAIEIDATDQPGLYRVDWPDAAFVAGVRSVILTVKVPLVFTEHLRVEIDAAVDAIAISGDKTAADNLKLMYDGTGYTDDTAPASRAQVGSIGSATGGGFNFQAVGSDALTNTIDNLGVAVDKGTSPETVGIPVTGHAFLAGHEVTLGGTTNYTSNPYVIDSVTANEVVIVATFVSETFAGSDTIVSSIKGDSIEGVQTTNTFSATAAEDGVYHVIDDDGSNNFTISYRFEVGGGRLATEAVFHGFLSGNNDNAFLQAYDFVGAAWETRRLLVGQNGSVNQTRPMPLLARNTGSSGVDLGVVFIRITDNTPSGSTNPTLNVDSLLVEAQGVGQTVGYANAAVWVDTVSGVAGIESFVNGVADKKVDLFSSALAIADAVGLDRFEMNPDAAITLAATINSRTLAGNGWTLDLNGQDINDLHVFGAGVTGIGTAATRCGFHDCKFVTASVQKAFLENCTFGGTVTLTLAGNYNIVNGVSSIAGASAPTFAKTAGQTITAQWRRWSGGINLTGLEAGDTLTISGELGTVDLGSPAGAVSVEIRGTYKELTNVGSAVVNIEGALLGSNLDVVLSTRAKGIAKNTAHDDIEFLMVASTDHVTPKTGLTVAGTRSIDGGSFASVSGSIAEVGVGVYQFDAAAADLNGDMITFRFTATDADDRYITIKTSS